MSEDNMSQEQLDADAELWSRFNEIETERYIYNPNEVGEYPLVGYLINVLDMPPLQTGKDAKGNPVMREWSCFLIKTTTPCVALDREKEPVQLQPGSEILVPATYQLKQHLEKAALNPEMCYEIIMKPKKKVDIGHGQNLWLYRLGYSEKTAKPRTSFGTAGLLGAPSPTKALPERNPAASLNAAAETVAKEPAVPQTPF